MTAAVGAFAFDTATYATRSVLASGRWVKVSVVESGLYCIPTATLRSWGFSDPSRVRIHGYGGRIISNVLSADNYVDDLPCVPAELTDNGLVFYAAGTDTWVRSSGEYYHRENSIYSTKGYYFLTESDDEAPTMAKTGVGGASSPVDIAWGRAHYEKDLTLASEAGTLFVGDDLRAQNVRSYALPTPGRTEGPVWMETQVVHNHLGNPAGLKQTVASGSSTAADTTFTDNVPATSDSHYIHGSLVCARHSCMPDVADNVEVDLTYTPKRTSYSAALDYISVNYPAALALDGRGMLSFWSSSPALSFRGADDLRIWDVTTPHAPELVAAAMEGGRHAWSVSRGGMREYVAWTPGARLPAPAYEGVVANQNLHAETDDADMIIFAPAAYASVARRIAALHAATDGIRAEVVDPLPVYNEFSSGAADISGLRKYLKMRYDRSAGSERPLRYVLLLGRATLDNRYILASTRRIADATLPAWGATTAKQSLSDNEGFLTDDFLAMLGDGSGADMGFDDLSVAVGRMPLTSAEEGNALVDKMQTYVGKSPRSGWKNRVLILADDEDQGVHLRQAEAMVANMEATAGQQHTFTKVYIDAYERSNGTVPEARKIMFDALDDGVAWWIFTGHANNHSWTGEAMLTFTDINSMYLRHIPLVLASTCDFLRWDSEILSGGEIMYNEPNGGAISMISATRPVYISDNAHFLRAFGRHALSRDESGARLTPGEIYRRTKNDIRNENGTHISNSNRLRFVFMGDPALPAVTPDNIVELTAINGVAADGSAQPELAAMATAKAAGRVTSPDGSTLTDFNGVVYIDVYDALRSVTTLANGEGGKEEIFDSMGELLYRGSAAVRDGLFDASIAMPSAIADNFREATMSMYARDEASGAEAVGANRNFYVWGFEEPETPDTTPPSIDSMALNHEGFEAGATVHSSPVVIASVSDNVGLNLSNHGVGHQMTLTLDESEVYGDVASFFTPGADGSPSGTIRYPLESLADGAHSLRLRVFDTSGNYAQKTVEFYVDGKAEPCIFDVYTDANPARTTANFYVVHDRPEEIMQVSVGVYDLMGRPVWSASAKGLSDMNVSPPVAWDLRDNGGRRVGRGIYLYRATATTASGTTSTATRRIAVAAQ